MINENFIGRRYGKLVVMEVIETQFGVFAKCNCDCGGVTAVLLDLLITGKYKSCGCKKSNSFVSCNIVQGMSHTRIYRCWASMIYRCENPKNKNYHQYGGKGIKICDEWHDFLSFMVWADKNGYKDNLTIDRIDHFGNYEPNNCRWITITDQQQNKSTTHYLTYNGETHSIGDWARKTGIDAKLILSRIVRGRTVEQALTDQVKPSSHIIEYMGMKDNIIGWARRFNIHEHTFYTRLKRNNFDLEYIINHFGDMYLKDSNTEVTNQIAKG